MATTASVKRERMHLRLDENSKDRIERAAGYLQQTATEFVLRHALRAADRVLRERQRPVVLQEPDWNVFFDALVDPPLPNRELRAAYRRYRRRSS